MEQVFVRGMELNACHGCDPEEQATPQPFRLNVTVDVAVPETRDDRIEDALDYTAVVDICRRVLAGPPKHLLESLAQEIATGILALDHAAGVEVEIEKLSPPIADFQGTVGVRVYREAEL